MAGVTLDEWNRLPESVSAGWSTLRSRAQAHSTAQMRDAVTAFSGVPRKDGEFEELMRVGRMHVSKYGIRRTGLNAAFRDALLEAGSSPGPNPEADGDDSDSP